MYKIYLLTHFEITYPDHSTAGDNEALIPADVFFAKIMEDTDTYITWPNKLKIGAKSKKGKQLR